MWTRVTYVIKENNCAVVECIIVWMDCQFQSISHFSNIYVNMQWLQEKEIPKNLNEKLKTSLLTQSEAFIPIFALSEILSGIQTKR